MSDDKAQINDDYYHLTALKSGDGDAFAILYSKYSRILLPKLKRMVKIPEVVDELMQDVFLKVWINRENIDLNKPFQAWVYVIAQRSIFDYYRRLALDKKMQAHLLESFVEFYEQTEDYILNKERNQLLIKAMEQLPPQRREVFRLCKIEGKSYKEAAELMSISSSTVSKQLVSAVKSVKYYVFFHSKEFLLFCIATYFRN